MSDLLDIQATRQTHHVAVISKRYSDKKNPKKIGMLVFETLKNKKSDFLNSNTCTPVHLIPSWLIWSDRNWGYCMMLCLNGQNPVTKGGYHQAQRVYCLNIYLLCMYHRHFLTCHTFTKKKWCISCCIDFFLPIYYLYFGFPLSFIAQQYSRLYFRALF